MSSVTPRDSEYGYKNSFAELQVELEKSKSLKQELVDVRSENEGEKTKYDRLFEKKDDAIKRQLDRIAELEKNSTEMKAQLDRVRERNEKSNAELKAERERLDAERTRSQTTLDALKGQHDTQMKNLTTQYDKQIKALTDLHDKEKTSRVTETDKFVTLMTGRDQEALKHFRKTGGETQTALLRMLDRSMPNQHGQPGPGYGGYAPHAPYGGTHAPYPRPGGHHGYAPPFGDAMRSGYTYPPPTGIEYAVHSGVPGTGALPSGNPESVPEVMASKPAQIDASGTGFDRPRIQ